MTKFTSFINFRREALGAVERRSVVMERAQAYATGGRGCQS